MGKLSVKSVEMIELKIGFDIAVQFESSLTKGSPLNEKCLY